MTSPIFHAKSSAKHWGGEIKDYLPIHQWFDETKEGYCDVRHRALRHHSQGIFEAERVFGTHITNVDGRDVPVRYIGEQHVREDCGGRIPCLKDWLKGIPLERWMSHGYKLPPEQAHEGEVNGTGEYTNWTGVRKGNVRFVG
jgi:hypothetical protein